MTDEQGCPECQALSGHCITCSRQTVDELAEKTMQYYEAWLEIKSRCKRLREQVTFWQGKHAILRLENNALRRKLFGKP